MLLFSLQPKPSTRLFLPRSVRNIRVKLNQSNPCLLDRKQALVVAGVRRDVFVWGLKDGGELLRSFHAHAGRILAMRLVQDKRHDVFVTSSVDRTVRVWETARLLEVVPEVDTMEFAVEKVGVPSKKQSGA